MATASELKFMKTFIACFLFAASCSGQSTFQQLFLNKATTGVSAVVRNTGQQYHRLDVFAPGGSCGGGPGKIFLEGSADNVSFIPMGAPIEQLSNYLNATGASPYSWQSSTSATGSYAYIRANILRVFNTACALTVNYVGTTNGTLVGSQPYNAVSDTFTTVISSDNLIVQSLVYRCPVNAAMLQIYAVSLSATGGANTVTLSMYYGSTAGFPIWTTDIALSTSNPNWIQPQGSRPYYTIPIGSVVPPTGTDQFALTMTLSAPTNVNYNFGIRCE